MLPSGVSTAENVIFCSSLVHKHTSKHSCCPQLHHFREHTYSAVTAGWLLCWTCKPTRCRITEWSTLWRVRLHLQPLSSRPYRMLSGRPRVLPRTIVSQNHRLFETRMNEALKWCCFKPAFQSFSAFLYLVKFSLKVFTVRSVQRHERPIAVEWYGEINKVFLCSLYRPSISPSCTAANRLIN